MFRRQDSAGFRESGGDRNGTTPENPEKTAISENGAAVPLDAVNEVEIDPELRLLIKAWPSLSTELQHAIMAIVGTGLATDSDGPQARGSIDRDELS